MAITVMVSEKPEWSEKGYLPNNVQRVEHNDRTLFLETTHAGLVLSLREQNGYNDSDFFALVWDPEARKPQSICYASTRGWTYLNGATIDATPDVVAAYEVYLAEQRAADQQRRAKYEARKPVVGARVRVVAGRKIPIGTEAEVVWCGEAREFGSRPRGGYKAAARDNQILARSMAFGDPRQGMRVGLLVDGQRVFTAATNVEVITA